MAGGLLGLFVRHQAFSPALPVIVAQLAALLLMVWARLTFGLRSFHLTASPTEGGLVRSGPYRFVRHPIYAAVCLFAWACSFGHPSLFSLAMAVVATLGAVVRLLEEERALRLRYPEYEEYARGTKRLVPFVL